ncbi:MAG TPA: M23 family metallopeptidase [Rhizobiaceae bacterium]|nr:M23 family metallopeptidase [Rhizobiaceae bacterium]
MRAFTYLFCSMFMIVAAQAQQQPNGTASSPPSQAEAPADEAMIVLGRSITEDFQQGRFDALWDLLTPEFQKSLDSADALAQVRQSVEDGFGEETKVLTEAVEPSNGVTVYTRRADHAKGVKVVTQVAVNDAGKIARFIVQKEPEAAQSRFMDYQTKANLSLPFEGEWMVVWGGREIGENYHAVDRAQRLALDVLMINGSTSFTGDGKKPEDYLCWDKPIIAPADGTVVSIVENLPDQQIGKTDPANPAGNHVVLDLGGGEFVFLAHLREGSVTVEPGDTVVGGGEIGRCGNSGNTTEPHLHIHMQTTADLATGEGLPMQFQDYVANGKPVEKGEPKQGEVVAPSSAE